MHFGACSTRSTQKFSTNKFSINFPENFHIENNNTGAIFAASKSTDPVIVVDYEDIERKENRNFCNNLREDFFSKVTSNREPSELYGVLVKRDGYDLKNKEIFVSLAFYCRKGIALHISYI